DDLIHQMLKIRKKEDGRLHLVDGLVNPGDLVILVTPIDQEAPKGRLILPQQQVLRDLLDNGALALVVKETELEQALPKLVTGPALVITDSRVFAQVNAVVPAAVPLTSFSILYARRKGKLAYFYQAVQAIKDLQDGDRVLVAEGCTHHRQDDDIGTVVIPGLLSKKTGKKLCFDHVSGGDFAMGLAKYKLVIHCGACMLNEREMEYRQGLAAEKGVPMINYGLLLAYLQGVLARAIAPFQKELKVKRGF
ncbi:MAG: [FeFe] hydrogenase H-cluster maturation GTPase HydF, partial [Firmicutes bacterium]|nr:[FeFe] hydrogenase H-cluster maturation GTPase HydF [Bacillota bacterium]